jgi:hypothetical protein
VTHTSVLTRGNSVRKVSQHSQRVVFAALNVTWKPGFTVLRYIPFGDVQLKKKFQRLWIQNEITNCPYFVQPCEYYMTSQHRVHRKPQKSISYSYKCNERETATSRRDGPTRTTTPSAQWNFHHEKLNLQIELNSISHPVTVIKSISSNRIMKRPGTLPLIMPIPNS